MRTIWSCSTWWTTASASAPATRVTAPDSAWRRCAGASTGWRGRCRSRARRAAGRPSAPRCRRSEIAPFAGQPVFSAGRGDHAGRGKGVMMKTMWLRAGVLATVAIAVSALGVPAAQAQAAPPSWQPALLPLPAGADPAGRGFLTGSNGRGEYTGSFVVGDKLQVVSWRGGKPVLRGTPDGYEWAQARDENAAGTVVGTATDYDTTETRAFVLDAKGFHLRDTPAGYRETQTTAINSRGDVLGQVFNEDPAKDGAIVWPAGGGAPVIIPVTHEYEFPMDIDDDGTVL